MVVSFILVGCAAIVKKNDWPIIKETQLQFKCFVNHKDKIGDRQKVIVYGNSNRPIYSLIIVASPDYFEEKGDEFNDGFDYSGFLECRLYPFGQDKSNLNILWYTQNATRDWQSFGRFLHNELLPLSSEYYIDFAGSRRIVQYCKARGMKIKIEIFNVKANKENYINELTVLFTFKRDVNAFSEFCDVIKNWDSH